uniref:Orf91 n=1 Tax=Acavomonas peruviana TaxID=1542312 RepID=V5KVH0_9ALVE|nr:orf91 [Acavomonas peruviana]AHA41672.1 orf91 [Acavomonas peruviana]
MNKYHEFCIKKIGFKNKWFKKINVKKMNFVTDFVENQPPYRFFYTKSNRTDKDYIVSFSEFSKVSNRYSLIIKKDFEGIKNKIQNYFYHKI